MAADGALSYALLRAAKAHKAVAATLLREIGLYPGQELLLMHLWDEDDRTQAELVRALTLDASTVTRMVVRLEERGVVRRRASSVDARAVIVSLTAHGRKVCEQVREVWAQIEDVTIAALTERQRADMLQSLRKITAALAAEGATGAQPT